MSRDRLDTVIRQRELIEQRHLVARAEAERARLRAEERAARAQARVEGGVVTGGTLMTGAGLQTLRTQGLALTIDLAAHRDDAAAAQRTADRAEAERVQAAIARRSVERLQQRRADAARRDAERHQQRRDEDAALIAWRRRR